jgi:hypothetical protein
LGRKDDHRLSVEDLKDALEFKPEVLAVITGYSGLMRIPPETRRYVESEGIEFLALKTAEACEAFNRLAKSRKVVATLHLDLLNRVHSVFELASQIHNLFQKSNQTPESNENKSISVASDTREDWHPPCECIERFTK